MALAPGTSRPGRWTAAPRLPSAPRMRRTLVLLLAVLLAVLCTTPHAAATTAPAPDLGQYTPDEAYQHALALLRSVTLSEGSAVQRTPARDSARAGALSRLGAALSARAQPWADAALYDTGPLGRLANWGRRWWRSRRPTRLRRWSKRRPDLLELRAATDDNVTLVWPGQEPRRLWPAWEANPDHAFLGPFLGDDQSAEERSYTDRVVAFTKRSVLRLVTQVTGKPTARAPSRVWSPLERREHRVSSAERLLLWVAGDPLNGPYPKARALVDDALAYQTNGSGRNNTLPDPSPGFPHSQGEEEDRKSDALWVLGEHYLWGSHGSEANATKAQLCFTRLADTTGNSTAHARLGFLYASRWASSTAQLVKADGLWLPSNTTQVEPDEVPHPQALAHLHYATAARQGNAEGQTALAYRHLVGIGTSPSCPLAMQWYEQAADQAYARFISGPPGGLTLPPNKVRLSDFEGGVYGPGASVASSGPEAAKPLMRAILDNHPGLGQEAGNARGLSDLLEFYEYHANHGEISFLEVLAQVYYHGSLWGGDDAGLVPRDYKRALEYLVKITTQVWPRDSATVARLSTPGVQLDETTIRRIDPLAAGVGNDLGKQAARAAGRIGRMYLRGEGVRQDFARAWVWFRRGLEWSDTSSAVLTGIMFRDGLGMAQRNVSLAARLFTKATTYSNHPDAPAQLGKILFDMGDYADAREKFRLAILEGNSFEARYFMGKLDAAASRASGGDAYCRSAVSQFKTVVERGDWESPVYALAERAWRANDRSVALLGWMITGEKGYEAAQNNIAWVLDRDKSLLSRFLHRQEEDPRADRLALLQWSRSAAQGNIDSLVKMGDYYSRGLGAPVEYNKAAACYQSALDHTSSLAYWDMAWMYETGRGVPQRDFYLAKRYYDMAWEINQREPYLPVLLSLIRLHWRAARAAIFEDDKSAILLWSQYYPDTQTNAKFAYTEQEERALLEQFQPVRAPDAAPTPEAGQHAPAPRPASTPPESAGSDATWHRDLDDEWEMEDVEYMGLEGLAIVLILASIVYLYFARRDLRAEQARNDASLARARGQLPAQAQARVPAVAQEPAPVQAEAAPDGNDGGDDDERQDWERARLFADAAANL